MPSLFGSSGSSGPQSAPGAFLPPNQAGMAQNFQDLIAPLQTMSQQQLGQYQNLGWPGVNAYPSLLNASFNIANNPYNPQAYAGTTQALDLFNQNILPNALQGAGGLQNVASQLQSMLGLPMQALNQPNYGQALQAGQQAGGQLMGAGNQILNQAFDPQQAIFNRLQQQTTDQANVANAMAGLGSSPYGASTTANALGNLDLNWQNQLLNRMTTGTEAARGAFGSAISDVLDPAKAYSTAVNQAIGGTGAIGSGMANAYTGAANLLSPLPGQTMQLNAAPMNLYNQQQGNTLNAMGQLINLGNQGFQTPVQNTIGDIAQYLGLGQSAAQLQNQAAGINNQIGQTNFAQLAGGLGGGANLLFGNSLGNSGGLLGLTGLNPFSGGGFLGGGAADFGGGADALATGGIDLSAAGFDFSSLLPDLAFIGL